jgi:lysozyme family protein
MADALTAIMITLDPAHEGGFQNNTNDRANWTGGKVGVGTLEGTNGGITALDMPAGTDMRSLTTEQKVAYYTANYWKPFYSQINSQLIANKLFDMGVLFGIGTATRILQGALGVNVDGNFGPQTLAQLNVVTVPSAGSLLGAYKTRLHAYAAEVAMINPLEAEDRADWDRRIDS